MIVITTLSLAGAIVAGMSVSEIFDTFGEPYFRDGERRVIARLLEVCFGDGRDKHVTDRIALMNLLRMACALEPYLRRYTAEIEPRYILDFLLFEWLSANFPNHYSIILGLIFIAIVFVLPKGILPAVEMLISKRSRGRVPAAETEGAR